MNQRTIKEIIRENNVRQYDIAMELGMHESALSRKLRLEPDNEEFREKVIEAIKTIKSKPLVL